AGRRCGQAALARGAADQDGAVAIEGTEVETALAVDDLPLVLREGLELLPAVGVEQEVMAGEVPPVPVVHDQRARRIEGLAPLQHHEGAHFPVAPGRHAEAREPEIDRLRVPGVRDGGRGEHGEGRDDAEGQEATDAGQGHMLVAALTPSTGARPEPSKGWYEPSRRRPTGGPPTRGKPASPRARRDRAPPSRREPGA